MELSIVSNDEHVTHIALQGRLFLNESSAFEEEFQALSSSGPNHLMIDMTEVPFISSQGIRLFLRSAKELAKSGRRLVLINPQPLVTDILRTAGITDLVRLTKDEYDGRRLLESL